VKKIITMILVSMTALSINAGQGRNFSAGNLQSIPLYEKYIFKGETKEESNMPIVFEYQVDTSNSDTLRWQVNGSMQLSRNTIAESYTIQIPSIYIESFNRKQSFKRGYNITTGEFHSDVTPESDNEFLIGTVQSVWYILRTFPFSIPEREIKIRAPQQKKNRMNFKVRNKGLISFETRYRGTVMAYHLELSLMVPVVGAFIPKLNFYFLNDDIKTLIAMKGHLPAGTGKMDVELVEYESSKKKLKSADLL